MYTYKHTHSFWRQKLLQYPTMSIYEQIQLIIPSDSLVFLQDVIYWFDYKEVLFSYLFISSAIQIHSEIPVWPKGIC